MTPLTTPNFTPSRRASRKYRCDAHAKGDPPTKASDELRDLMKDWIDDMIGWGQDVRDDIIRLEAAAGLPTGDPADPPPRPWK